jgi:hypothetical protein
MEDNKLIYDRLNKIDEKLNKIIQRQDDFELRLESLEEKRNEIYYQKFLEKRLGATHKRTDYGITDISTKNEHIEIKQWRDYKTALGQLLSYNFKDTKNLCVYFFGTIKDEQKTNIIDLFRAKNIKVYEFIDTLQGIVVNCLLNDNNEKDKLDFYKWLQQNIVYKENQLLQLKDICLLYLNTNDIHSSISSKYRKEVEMYIKETYKNLKCEYGKVRYNNVTTKYGWKHLYIKNE